MSRLKVNGSLTYGNGASAEKMPLIIDTNVNKLQHDMNICKLILDGCVVEICGLESRKRWQTGVCISSDFSLTSLLAR